MKHMLTLMVKIDGIDYETERWSVYDEEMEIFEGVREEAELRAEKLYPEADGFWWKDEIED